MKIPVIFGPTASGKTSIAKEILSRYPDVQFIVVDSRKIYRYMDIGTNKPPMHLRKHFSLLDIRNPDEYFSAADFVREAEEEIERISASGKIPVFIGGTVLYLKAFFEGLFEAPPISKEVRSKLRERLKKEGIKKLYEELRSIDPEAAERIHPNDWFRILRALEVYYQTGKPISQLQKKTVKKNPYMPVYLGVFRSREDLYERINLRFDQWIQEGFLDEVKRLIAMGYDLRFPALNTIGYKELILYLQSELTLEKAIQVAKRRTRILARRQIYFSRSLKPPVRWIPVEQGYDDFIKAFEDALERVD